MVTTTSVTATGIFEADDGPPVMATASLAAGRLVIRAEHGGELAVWAVGDLVQSVEHRTIRLRRRRPGGAFVVPAGDNPAFILALATVADADGPLRPRALVAMMAGIVAATLLGLVLFAWVFFFLIDWLFAAPPPGSGAAP